MHIARRIVKLRKELMISRKELSEGVVSYSHMGNIESGKYVPSEEVLKQLAERLDVPEEYLKHYDQKSKRLEKKLQQLNALIENEVQEAKEILDHIRRYYPYINSLEQEIYYYLLESCYHLKVQETDRGIRIFEEHYMPLIDEHQIESLPGYIQELHYYVSALMSYQLKDYLNCYHCYLKQLPLVEGDLRKAKIYFNIALALSPIYDFNNAIKYAKQALEVFTKLKKWFNAAHAYNMLGVLHWETRSFIKSEWYLLEGLDLCAYHDLDQEKHHFYHNLGLLYAKKKDFDRALEFFRHAIRLKKAGNIGDITKTYRAIIEIYIDQGEVEEADLLLQEAKNMCSDDTELHFLKSLEAKIVLQEGNNGRYEELMIESFEYFFEIKHFRHIVKVTQELGDYYQKARKYKKACHFYKLAIDAYDHLDGKGGL